MQSQSSMPNFVFLLCRVEKRSSTEMAPRIGNKIPQAVTLTGLTYVIVIVLNVADKT